MVIDFHTHVFPDKIASKTVDYLAGKADIPPFSDGTVEGLMRRMEESNTSVAVNLPVLTKPSQFEGTNRFALQLNQAFSDNKRKIISFAGIHPACENIEEKMLWIAKNGFKGVKIHPDYQETFINDEGYIKILQCAKDYDLTVVTHSGVDAAYRGEDIHCSPELVLRVLDKVPHEKFVLAHYGANEMLGDVFDMLCGQNIYFDTAYVLRFIEKEQFIKIMEKHGADRILFASDSPWSSIKNDIEIIKSFSLGNKNEEKIFSENAKKLLGI